MRRTFRSALCSAAVGLLIACIPRVPAGELPAPEPRPAGHNPFAGARLFVDPTSNARRTADTWRSTRPADAALLDRIAHQPQAEWLGDWNGNISRDVAAHAKNAADADALAVLVAYNIPNRDCGQHSAGGSGSAAGYRRWIRDFARGISGYPAAVILEPDALGLIDKCLSAAEREERLSLLQDAVRAIRSRPKAAVYIDAGNAKWVAAAEMAGRLKAAGVAEADGFALNVSNYISTADTVAYGEQISKLLGGAHFVIDTSRNGNGPTVDYAWCNPKGRAIGHPPTADTGHALVDAYLWIKRPGESDGACNGGPRAGAWWPEQALELARGAGS
jgi:endoglucanase